MPPELRIDRCVCEQTTFARLLILARANHWDLPALGAATGCGMRCGLCRPYLREMLMNGTTVFHQILSEPPSGRTGA